jgi:hypothetical protein
MRKLSSQATGISSKTALGLTCVEGLALRIIEGQASEN